MYGLRINGLNEVFHSLNSFVIQNPEGHRPKWKHKHINTWWLMHTKHTKGNKIENTWKVITWFNISLIITTHTS